MPFSNFFKTSKMPLETKVKETFASIPTLYSQRLEFVKIEPQHAPDMFEYSSDADVTKYLTWSCHKSEKETERYINLLQKKYQSGAFNDWGLVYKATGKFIGTCGFTGFDYHNNLAEIGYVLAKPFWGMGLACEAVKRVMHFGFCEFSLSGFFAKCMEGNDASFKVMQKCGMTLDGIYKNSMFIKGEYKTIIKCSVSKETFYEKFNQLGDIL